MVGDTAFSGDEAWLVVALVYTYREIL